MTDFLSREAKGITTRSGVSSSVSSTALAGVAWGQTYTGSTFNSMTASPATSVTSGNLLDLPPARAQELIRAWVIERGLPSYRAGQILHRLWQAPVESWQGATDLPASLRT